MKEELEPDPALFSWVIEAPPKNKKEKYNSFFFNFGGIFYVIFFTLFSRGGFTSKLELHRRLCHIEAAIDVMRHQIEDLERIIYDKN